MQLKTVPRTITISPIIIMSNASENAILRSAPDSTTAITSAKGDVIGSFRYHCWPWSKQFEIFSLQNEFLPYHSLVRLMAIIAASSSHSAPIQVMFQIFAITPCAPQVQGATNNQPTKPVLQLIRFVHSRW